MYHTNLKLLTGKLQKIKTDHLNNTTVDLPDAWKQYPVFRNKFKNVVDAAIEEMLYLNSNIVNSGCKLNMFGYDSIKSKLLDHHYLVYFKILKDTTSIGFPTLYLEGNSLTNEVYTRIVSNSTEDVLQMNINDWDKDSVMFVFEKFAEECLNGYLL
jgi:hypothetical protein